MKKNFTFKFLSVILATSILLASCVSSTLIQSIPPGAKVYIDGEPAGITPYWYSDTKITGSVTNVDLLKEGFEPLLTSFSRTEQVDVGAIIGGLFVWVPFLWTMQYKPTHSYELVTLQQQPEDVTPEVPTPQLQQQQNQPQLQPQTEPQNEPTSTKGQRLRELKKLLDQQLITKDDYESHKQKILDEK